MEKRKYNVPDSELVEFIGTVIYHLDEDLPRFTVFDPDLNADKKNHFSSLHNQTLTNTSDRQEQAKITAKTIELKQLTEHSNDLVTRIRYFAEKQFKKRTAILQEFGFKTYRNASRNQPKLIQFMYLMVQVVDKYRTELLESGLPEDVINEVKPITDALNLVNTQQEARKNARKVSTTDRTEVYNQVYDVLGEFSDAAAIIFANDPIRRQRYVLPHNNTKKTKVLSDPETETM